MPEQKTLLIACNNAENASGLANVFFGLKDVRMLPIVLNGREAIGQLLTRDVDILLLDLILAEVDGLGVLDFVGKLSEDRRPLVFVMTEMTDDRLLYTIRDRILYCFIKPLKYEIVQMRVLGMMHAVERDVTSESLQMDILETQIAAGIRAIGMPPHLKGHYYLRDAIRLFATAESQTELCITTDIYPTVAKLYNTRPPLVEHAMRNAIEITWTRGNIDVIHDYFGYTVNDYKGKPTNLEFVATMAQRALTYIKKR